MIKESKDINHRDIITAFSIGIFEHIGIHFSDSHQELYLQLVNRLMVSLSQLEVAPHSLLEYQTHLHQQTVQYFKEMNEEDREEEESPQIIPPSLFLSSFGLGSYFYFMLVKNIHFSIPLVYSPERILVCCLPYISALIKHPKGCVKGLELGAWIVQRISPFSTVLRTSTPFFVMADGEEAMDIEHSVYFIFIQDLITFMVNCPISTLRTQAYHLFQGFLTIFANSERFEIIKRLLTTCPYPSFVGLVIHRLKQEIEWSWPNNSTQEGSSKLIVSPYSYPPSFPSPLHFQLQHFSSPSPFLSSQVLDLLTFFQHFSDLLSKLDIVMNILSVYRFLLIRDKSSNFTGIWNQECLTQIQDFFLNPLFKAVNQELKNLDHSPSEEEQNVRERVAKEHGLPSLSHEHVTHIHNESRMRLQLLKDTILRVKELMKGSEPLKGVPKTNENSNHQINNEDNNNNK